MKGAASFRIGDFEKLQLDRQILARQRVVHVDDVAIAFLAKHPCGVRLAQISLEGDGLPHIQSLVERGFPKRSLLGGVVLAVGAGRRDGKRLRLSDLHALHRIVYPAQHAERVHGEPQGRILEARFDDLSIGGRDPMADVYHAALFGFMAPSS